MTVTNAQSGTNVHEVSDGIYRINTPVEIPGAGHFSFNQYLIVDDQPLLFHTGPRKMFPHRYTVGTAVWQRRRDGLDRRPRGSRAPRPG